MKKLLSLSAIMAIVSLPAMAEITTGATCDTTNLGQSENGSTANVEADWSANTINIDWYSDDTGVAHTTCTYDGTITLPTEPTKTGYTFGGWQLAAACPSLTSAQCAEESRCVWNTTLNGCYYSGCANATTSSKCALSVSGATSAVCTWSNDTCVAGN